MKLTNWEVNKMNDKRLKGIAVILFGILLSASGEEMNRTVLEKFSNFPFLLLEEKVANLLFNEIGNSQVV